MRIIFLDIDGVLNCRSTPNPRNYPYVVDPRLLNNLYKLLERTGAEIVLSSTWRTDPVGLLAARYWKIPYIDSCPDMPDASRHKEMLKWLADHPGVERYIVIDDSCDHLDGLPLFQPDSKVGLTMDIVDGATRYLRSETDQTMRRAAIIRLCQNVGARFRRNRS